MNGSMIFTGRSGLKLGIYPVLDILAPTLDVYQSTRAGGASDPPFDSLNIGLNVGDRVTHVRKNRRLLLETIGTPPRRLARAEQVHGARIAVAERAGLYRGVDGLITTRRNLTLAMSTADCFPVVVFSVSERVLAALHVGHGGAAAGIIEKGIELMRRLYTIDTENCVALIGPGICWRCYEVGKDLASRFAEPYRRNIKGRLHLDLRSFCSDELRRKGIPGGRIYESGYCTSCDPDLFYSHRRDGGTTGRHWALARIRST